jgi:glycosyltransferase involved in cell wall biosynthesis
MGSDRAAKRQRLLVADMSVARSSPAGSCVLAEVQGLCEDFDVQVVSSRLDASETQSLTLGRVVLPERPVLLRYLVFQRLARQRIIAALKQKARPVLVQATQGQFVGADVCYAHFCHGAYLAGAWRRSPVRGLRRLGRWLTHTFNAGRERAAFARARRIVVPSAGLARELRAQYEGIGDKIEVIANPVDVVRFSRPPDFDRSAVRTPFGFTAGQRVLCFMALGDFSRKGLDLVLDAIAGLAPFARARVGLLVVGGQPSEIEDARRQGRDRGVDVCVRFAGMQSDVRPFLWCADVYVFPSAYEIFSLAALQALAAGLPVIVTRGLYGVEDYIVEGHNGWFVERSVDDVRAAIERALAIPDDELRLFSQRAHQSIQHYGVEEFQRRWRAFYNDLLASLEPASALPPREKQ